MPGFLVHVGATGNARIWQRHNQRRPNPRVLVSGQPTVTMPAPTRLWRAVQCAMVSPSPCLTAQWTTAATRVFSNASHCVARQPSDLRPNWTPLVILATKHE